jgi:hypothetical protein
VHFSPEELADLTRSVKRLILAAQDMIEARAAAVFLRERDDLGGDVRRALETAIPVAYARPWGKRNTIGGLEDHWLPTRPDYRAVHDEMILVRNKVYAHTDEEIGARWIHDMSSILGASEPVFVPMWRPLNPDLLDPRFIDLAEHQKDRFIEGFQQLQSRLSPVGRADDPIELE